MCRSIILWLRDFFSCLPFSLLSLPLGSRVKMGRERGGHGPETALKPQPLFEWGCLLVHYSAFPSTCGQKRGMWKCILVSFLTFLFVSPPPCPKSLRVNTSLTCAKKWSPTGISDFWFCCLALNIPLCSDVSLYMCLLHFCCHLPHCYTCWLFLHRTQCLNVRETGQDFVANNVFSLVKCIIK